MIWTRATEVLEAILEYGPAVSLKWTSGSVIFQATFFECHQISTSTILTHLIFPNLAPFSTIPEDCLEGIATPESLKYHERKSIRSLAAEGKNRNHG